MTRREMIRSLIAAASGITMASPVWGSASVSFLRRQTTLVGTVVHRLDAGAMALLQRLRVQHVRYTLYWHLWERDARYRVRFQSEVRRAADGGLDLLVVVHQPPSKSYARRREMHARFADFMSARVSEFPTVSSWQLYNEADVGFAGIDLFGAHSGLPLFQQGMQYARMLEAVAPAMRAAGGSVKVIANGCATDGREWARGVIEGGGRDHLHAWALNCYGFPVELAVREKVLGFRQAIGADHLWVTEFGMESAVIAPGWPSSTADVDRYHRDAWRESVLWNDTSRQAERMYGYVLSGHGDFDLVRPDGSLRPAAEWLRAYLAD